MHFVFYPRHEFGCPHVGHCPHLGGAPLSLLVHAADQGTEWTNALHRQIDALREENTAKCHKIEELTARVEQLQRDLTAERQKQFKHQKEESAGEDLASPTQNKKKRGAPLGHPGWYRRRPETFEQLIFVSAPQSCPHCGGSVKARPDRAASDHLQEDWIDGKHLTVCYRHEASRCRKCRRWVKQLGKGELPRAMLGPSLRAASLFLQYDIGMTTRKVVRTIVGLAQLAFSPGSLLRFGWEAGRKAQPLVQDVAEKLRACPSNHADETHYRIDGRHAYVWFHGNEHLAHFCVTATRSGKVSRAILGEDYQGGLHMDCYAGYDRHKTRIKQRCLAHLKRTAETWCKLLPKEASCSRAFFAAVTEWVKRGCVWHRKRKSGRMPEEIAWLRQELERLQQMPTDSPRALRLQKRLRRYRHEWLTFLDHPDVAPTNNLAEQALRAVVILRKLTFGSRTRGGAKRLGRMMTVIETAKRQGQGVVKFLVALFTLPPNQAMRAMYAQP
jgi:transposase